jgi:hypothetical protein
MKLRSVNTLTDIKKGDKLIINGRFNEGDTIQLHKVLDVKVTTNDGTEIILRKKGNLYFNLGMYLRQGSWVNEVCIIEE